MIEYFYKKDSDDHFYSIPQVKDNCWIYVEEATLEDLETVCQLAGLEYVDIQDSLDRYEIPRIERVHHHTLIYTRHPIELDIAVGLYTATLTFVITGKYFISISPQRNHLLRNFLSRKIKIST